jgi:hypothetical protein
MAHTVQPGEPFECHATVYLLRHRDPEHREEVAQFRFTDLADVAAHAICERYGHTVEVCYADASFKPRRYEWGTVEREGVVKVGD